MLVSHLAGLSTQALVTCSYHSLCRPRTPQLLLLVVMNLHRPHSPVLGKWLYHQKATSAGPCLVLKARRG